jgi:ankyrin repeat protein
MLCEAAAMEDPAEAMNMVRGLLDSGVPATERVWDGIGPLTIAAEVGHWEVVRLLMARGADRDGPGRGRSDALYLLATDAPEDLLGLLLQRSGGWLAMTEVQPTGERSIPEHPISTLAERGNFDRLDRLWKLGMGILLDVYESDLGWTPLIDAAGRGDLLGVKWLLTQGAHVNAHAEFRIGPTALERAVDEGHAEVVRWLLGAGANPNIPTWMWRTAAERAVRAASESGTDRALAIRDCVLAASSRYPPPVYPDGRSPGIWPPTSR